MSSSSSGGPASPSPPRALAVAAAAAAAAAAAPQTLTLALPAQTPESRPSRDDCWSDGATSALIDAWGERYLDLAGPTAHIRQNQWADIADAVSSRDDYTKPPKSDLQCKNRLDTLKKKYKMECSKPPPSRWPFFPRLNDILCKQQPLPVSTLQPHYQSSSSSSSSDGGGGGLPPQTPTQQVMNSLLRFGEVYERVERARMRQEMEMERQRMGFERDVVEQRMQFFMKAHVELSGATGRKRKRGPGGGGSGTSNNAGSHWNGEGSS